ncbi:hypothetical protein D3C75_1191350 [compost metagenome]
MHPGDNAGNLVTIVDFFHDRSDFVRADGQILQYERIRQNTAVIERVGHSLCMSLNFSKCFFSVKMLRSYNKPELLGAYC